MATRKNPSDLTAVHIQRLWDWYGSNSYAESTYFCYQNGEGIANFLETTGRLKGKILDYGCGAGHLLDRLLKRNLQCYGVDSSTQSIEKVKNKFSIYSDRLEVRVIDNIVAPYPKDYFDVITCIETLEHIPDDLIAPLLSELKRLLKPGGLLIITTPFAENLEANLVYCPYCDSEYHKWQHMRTLTMDSMRSLLQPHDFQIEFCRNMDFARFAQRNGTSLPPIYHLSPAKLYVWTASRMRKALDKLFPAPFPGGREVKYKLTHGGHHLCALVTKR